MTADLLEAARAGDPAALEELMRERRAQVVRYAMRLCISPADAEDARREALRHLAVVLSEPRPATPRERSSGSASTSRTWQPHHKALVRERVLAKHEGRRPDAGKLADVSLLPYVAGLPMIGASGLQEDLPNLRGRLARLVARESWCR